MIPFVYAESSIVTTGGDREGTSYNHQRKLARTSDGTLHAVYYRSNGTSKQIFYSYSLDEGVTWVEEQVSFPPVDKDQRRPSIAADSRDNLHVVWSGYGWGNNTGWENIQYRVKTPSGWQPQEGLTDMNQSQFEPSIVVDSQDNVHVAWYGWGWGNNTGYYNIQYRVKAPSGWQPREGLTDVASSQSDPAIAIDSKDNIHLVWHGRGWSNKETLNLQYMVKTSSGWQAREPLTDVNANQYAASIAVDSLDNVHVVWGGHGWGVNTNKGNIQYLVRTSSGWQAQENVTDINDTQYLPSIAVDSLDNVHVVWTGWGWGNNIDWKNIQYRMKTPSGWQPQEGLTNLEYSQTDPNLIWAEWPDPPLVRTDVPKTGFAFIYIGKVSSDSQYNVTYYASEDLTWGEKSHPEVELAPTPVGGEIIPQTDIITCIIILTTLAVSLIIGTKL
jgi:hypothetical protein